MPFKWEIIPVAEWLPDQPEYESPGMPNVKNVIASTNSYKPFSAVEAFSDAVVVGTDDYLRGAAAMTDNDLQSHVFAATSGNIYELSANAWDDVSKAGGYSGTATTEIWDFTQWGNQIIGTSYNNATQIMTLGSPPFANLANAPQARFCTVVRDFVVLGSLLESGSSFPRRVRWSGFNNATLWTPSVTTQSDFQDILKGGRITGLVGGESGLVFQEEQINTMIYEGPPRIFRFDVPSRKIGCRYPGSITRYGWDVFFLGDADWYKIPMQGGAPQPLGQERVAQYIRRNLDESYWYRLRATPDVTRKLILLAYPDRNSSNGMPNRMLVYNIEVNRFTEIDQEYADIFIGLGAGFTLEGLDALYSSIEDVPISLDDPFWTGGRPRLGMFNASNQLGFPSGEPLPAQIDTAEKRAKPGKKLEINNLRPWVEGFSSDVRLRIGTRNGQDESVTWTQQIFPNSHGEYNKLTESRFARVRIETSGSFGLIQGVEADVREGGQY